ncbi:hypothetical protein PMAYCL1PPCAC_25508 [Pristionchus mayeri]|uniref:MATH domain-containing protein n=1 Tax=Pristionchus mayeri TaxID=1317129 RepID=A0AAN5D2H2_9BILA|nr:hypothetical protein PMAYCL1PPCAC_25508 [Pristionchus mayeri]
MTCKSKVVLRWEVDNEKLLSHEYVMDSVVFKEAGFAWKASTRPFGGRNGLKSFLLSCESDRRDWKCAANVELLIHRAGGKPYSEIRPSTFTCEKKQCWFHNFELEYFRIGNKYRVEFTIEIMKAQGGEYIGQRPINLAQFSSAHEKDNVTLIIESKKVRVSKKFLTANSLSTSLQCSSEISLRRTKKKLNLRTFSMRNLWIFCRLSLPLRLRLQVTLYHFASRSEIDSG